MHYSLGTRGLHARLCEILGKVFGARLNPATITYNAKASVLAAHQHIQSSSASSAPTCSVISRDTMHCDPPYERTAAKTFASLARCIFHCTMNSVTAPFMAEPNKKTCNRAARAAKSNEPFHTTQTDTHTNRHIYPRHRNTWQDFYWVQGGLDLSTISGVGTISRRLAHVLPGPKTPVLASSTQAETAIGVFPTKLRISVRSSRKKSTK
jgi:hypothetical protein